MQKEVLRKIKQETEHLPRLWTDTLYKKSWEEVQKQIKNDKADPSKTVKQDLGRAMQQKEQWPVTSLDRHTVWMQKLTKNNDNSAPVASLDRHPV